MHYRRFQQVDISEIGLGTWQLGSSDWGTIKEEDAFAILDAFTSAGGNFVDTADVYGMGVSEKFIGSFLKSTGREVYVGTKLGRRHDSSCGWPQNFSYDVMRRHIEASLEHLGLSQLFLEQLHCIPTAELKSGQVFKHLRAFQEEGLIRHWGVSVETSDEALLCLEQDGLSSLQVIFNLFRQHVADEFFAKAAEKGVAIIVRVPLASGLLTGKFTEDTKFQESDHRHYNAKGEAFNAGETFSGIDFHEGIKFSRQLAEILPQGNMPQAALRWILDHKEVTTVIPGASSVSQARSNLAASDMQPLKPGVHQQLRQLYNDEIRPVIRGHY